MENPLTSAAGDRRLGRLCLPAGRAPRTCYGTANIVSTDRPQNSKSVKNSHVWAPLETTKLTKLTKKMAFFVAFVVFVV